MIRRVLMAFAMLAIASVPMAGSTLTLPGAVPREQPFNRFYLIDFRTQVGSDLPYPGLCLLFTPAGTWSAVHNVGVSGTYLLSGRELFASALANWSPTVNMTLQGTVTRKGGSGQYIVNQQNGTLFSGGTFTMIREYSSGCS